MLPAAQPLLLFHQAGGSVPWLTPWFRSSRPGVSGTCPQCTRTRRRSTSAPRCTLRPSVRTGIPNRSGRSIPSPPICIGWPTGSNSAGSRRSSWNPPGSTGFRSTRSWNNVGSRCRWSMPGMPGTVPGRKTDVSDAQWLQRLHEYGLLRSSFRPQGEIATLRAYLRPRERLLDNAAAHIQHMQKALTQMNLQLHHVVSDITGVTGMRIIRAIVNGERDPDVLASFRDRCHASVETIRQALIGNDREEHIFALSQALELYDIYQTKVAECDKRIAAVLKRLKEASPTPADPLPAARHKGRSSNPLTFDVREALYAVIGIDLTQIHGPYLALKLVGECGTDLSAWPALHVVAWPGAAQQDLRREGSVLANAPFRQPGGIAVAAGGSNGRTHRHGAGRLLPPVVSACRQGQGRHRHCP